MTNTHSLPIQPPPARTSRRVSMSSEKALSSSMVKASFEPYPSQSVPVNMNMANTKKKVRRPSETAPVLCQKCGKNYKHQQCLVKHLWEHSPYWDTIPNAQPLSKHQKVQLLETASILCKLSGSPNLRNGHSSLSPSPFGNSQLSNADFHARTSGIILEADDEDDDDDDEIDSGEGDSSPRAQSSVTVEDDDDQEIFGRMDQ